MFVTVPLSLSLSPLTLQKMCQLVRLCKRQRRCQITSSALKRLNKPLESRTRLSFEELRDYDIGSGTSRLRQLYYTAHCCADDFGIRSWTLHYQEYSKMACRAVNIAMDSKQSVQTAVVDNRAILDHIAQYLDNDVQEWISTSLAEQ
uniref:Uncharacterized protein n=1 Tax=Hyaloperonospora arabidopsidis (strain Emoy2) TaxID=559515 RepID=M4BQ94_HYAAE